MTANWLFFALAGLILTLFGLFGGFIRRIEASEFGLKTFLRGLGEPD